MRDTIDLFGLIAGAGLDEKAHRRRLGRSVHFAD